MATIPANEIVVINLDFINSSDIELWRTSNAKYFCNSSNPDTSCVHNKAFIDTNHPDFGDFVTLADWLKANGSYICYPESYLTFEHQHQCEVKPAELIGYIAVKIVWNDLKKEIDKPTNRDFNKYVCMDIKNAALEFDYNPNHYDAENSFSVPLFDSVVLLNDLDDNSVFEFWKIKDDRIVFGITAKSGRVVFYNISHCP